MLDFQKKKKIKKVLYSPITLILLLLLFLAILNGTFSVYKKMELSIKNLEREEFEMEKLKERESILANSIEYLKTEQGIEDELRTKFRAVKEGEKVVVIIDNKEEKNEIPTTTEKSLLYKIIHWPQY